MVPSPTPETKVFRQPHIVRFADVDAAGIVYYPRLLHYCHLTFEDFFPAAGGKTYAQWIQTERIGFPTVHLDVDFRVPVEFGKELVMAATVTRIGQKSVTFRFRGERPDGTICFQADVTKACAGMDTGKSQPIPDELRQLFGEYLTAEESA